MQGLKKSHHKFCFSFDLHNFDLRSKALSLDNKNKNIIILYCPRLFVPLSPI